MWKLGGRQLAGNRKEFFSNQSREGAVVVRPREWERERSKIEGRSWSGCRDDELNQLAKKRGLLHMKWAGSMGVERSPANGNAPHLKH